MCFLGLNSKLLSIRRNVRGFVISKVVGMEQRSILLGSSQVLIEMQSVAGNKIIHSLLIMIINVISGGLFPVD